MYEHTPLGLLGVVLCGVTLKMVMVAKFYNFLRVLLFADFVSAYCIGSKTMK